MMLDKRTDMAWVYMPAALNRIRAFCAAIDSDADPEMMAEAVYHSFVSDNPTCLCFLLLDDAGAVRGHLVVVLEQWMGCKAATIVQLETDVAIPDTVGKSVMAYLEGWARARGCKFFQCLARTTSTARLFEQRYDFKPIRVLLRRPIPAQPGEKTDAVPLEVVQ